MRRVLVESSYGSIWREIMEGISFYVRSLRDPWQVHCVTTPEIPDGIANSPDGLLCILTRRQTEMLDCVQRSPVVAVNMLRDLTPDLPSVLSDHAAIGRRAAEYFLARGFRRMAFVGVHRDWADQRRDGFVKCLAAQGIVPEILSFPMADLDLNALAKPGALRNVKRWLASVTFPAAIFAGADFISRALLDACRQERVRVPDDLALLGVDDDAAICELSQVPLSSIPQNLARIGFESARRLDGLMTRPRKAASRLLIPPREIVVRRSSDIIAVEDPHVAAALKFIHQADLRHLSIKTLLQSVHVSRQFLDRCFKHTLGQTLSERIRIRRLEEARRRLLQTRLPIHRIARAVGFSQSENLTRFFRSWTGLPPSEYRKRLGTPF